MTMNLQENTPEATRTKEKIFQLLHSGYHPNIELAGELLWELQIPEEWVVFLFGELRKYRAIEQLLHKHFPPEDYRPAYDWFDASGFYPTEDIDLLKKLPVLHPGFGWKYILPLCTEEYGHWPSNADPGNNLVSKLFNDPVVPKKLLLPLCINKFNVLDLYWNYINTLPDETEHFKELEGITTYNPIENLPFWITKLSNLQYLDLGESHRQSEPGAMHDRIFSEKEVLSAEDRRWWEEEKDKKNPYLYLKIEGKPFMEVMQTHNPEALCNILLHRWLGNARNNNSRSELDEIIGLGVQTPRLKFAEIVYLLYQAPEQEAEALILLKELYEQDNFYTTRYGKSLGAVSNYLDNYKNIRCLEYIVSFFEQQQDTETEGYAFAVFLILLHYVYEGLSDEEIRAKQYSLIRDICRRVFPLLTHESPRLLVVYLQYLAITDENKREAVQSRFQQELERLWEPMENYCMGFLTHTETFNQMMDVAYREGKQYQGNLAKDILDCIEK